MKVFCGLTHWQWTQWQYDRRMAYQKTYKPVWRCMNDDYFIRNTSEATRRYLTNTV